MNVGPIEPVYGFYASSESLRHDMDFNFIVDYMADRKITFLETDTRPIMESLARILSTQGIENPDARYLSFFLTDRNDASCRWFNSWVARYPAQRLPSLRKNGLLPHTCIGVKGTSSLESRYRLNATISPILVYENDEGMWEHMLTVTDSTSLTQVADIRLVVSHNIYGDRKVLCSKKTDAERFGKIIPIAASDRYAKVSVDTIEEPGDFDHHGTALERDIEESANIRGVLSMNSTNIISEDGLTWFEHKYIERDLSAERSSGGKSTELAGYYLVTLRNGKLRRTLVRLGQTNFTNITGLLVTPSEVRFVAMSPDRTKYWLLEYSSEGEPKRALSLTDSQIQVLKKSERT
jgi:hypothetical protein